MHYSRPAIAMIELIFAIVVMGIVMMSAPMLVSTAQKTTSVALQQEGINQAVSRVSQILTHEWDENISANLESTGCVPVLYVSSAGDTELNMGTNRRRIGVDVNSSSRTFNKCDNNSSATPSASLGIEGSVKNDIDDFTDINLTDVAIGCGGTDYIEKATVDIATSVYYSSDAADYNSTSINFDFNTSSSLTNSTNIKTIKVTITSSSGVDELNKSITLHAFSCNTGDSLDFAHRSF